MAKVITLTGLKDDVMDFATPEALACLESGGIPVWDNAGGMVCDGVQGAPVAVTPKFDWKKSLKYTAVFGIGAGLGYFSLNKKVGAPISSMGGGAAALLGMLAFQKGGWLNKSA